jgi:hypothetical protein
VVPPDLARPPNGIESRAVASVELPRGTMGEDVLGAMAGRWFGTLRWLGVYERPGDPWLVWSVDGQAGHVLLGVRRGQLRVMVDSPRGSAEAGRLESGARELLRHALEQLRQQYPPAAPGVTPLLEGGATRDWVVN